MSSPPKPKPPSQSEQREQLEKSLERYTCTLDKETSTRARNYGLEHQKSVCSVVKQAVDELIRRDQEGN